MIEVVAITIIEIGGMAIGVCLGFGMWASGVRMTVATIERKTNTDI